FPDLAKEFFRCGLQRGKVERQEEIIKDYKERRSRATEEFLASFRGGDHDIKVVEQFWIVNAFLADLRYGDVNELASLDNVLYLQLNRIEALPPGHDGNPFNDAVDARAKINSDAYFHLSGMKNGCIGLLDTGLRSTHVMFGPAEDNIRIEADCVYGGPSCLDPSDPNFNPADSHGHGTSTAAILAGNANLGADFRGVTGITVDSWKVYFLDCSSGHCFSGMGGLLNAFQQALQMFDRVILVETQEPTPPTGPLAMAANNAFDAGAVVLAPTGNCAVSSLCDVPEGFPQPESVRSPANAHKVLGVGALNVQTEITGDYQGFGPTNDDRYKPDIQAPTDTETACQDGISIPDDAFCSNPGTDFSLTSRFGGTSGAGPYAAGAAALVRNWLRKFNTFDPGQTYSLMILSGTEINPYQERLGVGPIELPTCGFANWGKVMMEPVIISDPPEPGDPVPVAEVDIPIQVGLNNLRLDAALWWPTVPFQSATDLDLHLIDPFGNERAKADANRGVFERTRARAKKSVGELEPGT
ncbi:S8 family serine peptidase, partial [bacterium]|nr:S8 family serine peptidase [bacterium]